MTQVTASNYWISNTAIHIALNALGNPEYIVGSVASGAVIMVFMKNIDGDFFGYDAGHNHKRWSLSLSPTAFGTTSRKYVYAAIPKNTASNEAMIVFPSEKIDIYGYAHDITTDDDGNETDTPRRVGEETYYYLFLGGIISSSGENGDKEREWEQNIDCGMLSTDEGITMTGTGEFIAYDNLSDTIRFLKVISDATIKALKVTTSFILNGAKFIGKAIFGTTAEDNDETIVTPKYITQFGNAHFLRKDIADEANAHITFNAGTKTKGTAEYGTFNKGLTGGFIDETGDSELRRLTLREELIVPKITYNSQEWIGGNTWRSQGGGVIEAVKVDHANLNYCKLSLVDGEGGKISVGDKCQGIFHINGANNAITDSDGEYLGQDEETGKSKYKPNGNFTFAGFTTIYFRITEVLRYDDSTPALKQQSNTLVNTLKTVFGSTYDIPEEREADADTYIKEQIIDGLSRNQFFMYVLRADTAHPEVLENGTTISSDGWTSLVHPQPQMNFAVYANAQVANRQYVNLETPSYTIYLAGMTGWTYTSKNIQVVLGLLDGFSVDCVYWDEEQNKWVDGSQPMTGYSIAVGNMYQFGTTKQFERRPTLISQQLHYNATTSEDAPEYPEAGNSHGWDRRAYENGPIITKASKDYPFLWGYYTYKWSEGVTKNGEEYQYDKVSDIFLISNWAKDGTAINMKGSLMAYYIAGEWNNELIATLPDGLYATDDPSTGEALLFDVRDGAATTHEQPEIGDSYYNISDSAIYMAKTDGWQYVGNITVTTLKALYSAEQSPGSPNPDNIGDDKVWHETMTSSDIWMSTSIDNGISWTAPFRIVAEQSYKVEILAESGSFIIRNGQGSVSLVAHVYRGATEITNSLNNSNFVWKRISSDSSSDTTWNAAHTNSGKSLVVQATDVNQNAIFECTIQQ